jgi:hypothetical protein
VDVFTQVLIQGQRVGPANTPTAIETRFGWIVAGTTDAQSTQIVSHRTIFTSDDIQEILGI